MRETVAEDGGLIRVLQYDETETAEYERVVVEYPMDDPTTFIVSAYHSDADEPSFRDVFSLRELSFAPVSIAGLGERESLTGVSTTGETTYGEIPRDVLLSLHSLGFTAVPQGTGWLHE
jgi:hypothetical protein